MQKPNFIQFSTADGLTLPGLFFEASNSDKVAIYLHGNGSSSVFYSEDYTLPEELRDHNISTLLFNNRGAGIVNKLNQKVGKEVKRRKFGCTYEIIKECIEDIDGAISFLQKRGYKEFYLLGASTGANKICVYNHYKQDNKVNKYVLLGGGDDTGIYYNMLGSAVFWQLLNASKQKIKQGKGEDLILNIDHDLSLPQDFLFSYQAFYDIANPDGDYNVFPFYEAIHQIKLSSKPIFRYFHEIRKPTFVLYGELDEYAWGDIPRIVTILKKQQPNVDYKVIKNADHGFHEKKKELAALLIPWLNS